MSIHSFIDSHGVEWSVWSTMPSLPAHVDRELREGWLVFDNGRERRRLAPVPAGWENASSDRLDLMCRAAKPVRRSDPHGHVIAAERNASDRDD